MLGRFCGSTWQCSGIRGMSGNRRFGFDTRWLLANFSFSLIQQRKIRSQLKNISKSRENGIDRLRNGNLLRRQETMLSWWPMNQCSESYYQNLNAVWFGEKSLAMPFVKLSRFKLRFVIQQLLNEAEQDMKNSADQGGCYPQRPKAFHCKMVLETLQN